MNKESFFAPVSHLVRLVAAASLVVLAGCGGPGGTGGKPFAIGLQDDPKSLDPAVGYDIASWAIEHMIFQSLVTYAYNGVVMPSLAEKFEQKDATTYVFHLRKDATFHDGRPVTAKDVVYSLNRLLDPATKSSGSNFYTDIKGGKERLSGKGTPLTGVKAIDDQAVEIALTRPNQIFLQFLAMPFASVVPDGATSETLNRRPIGCGPYKLDNWTSGQRISLSRVAPIDRAVRPSALQITKVEILLGLNESLEVLKFERGELDVIGALRNIPSADFTRLESDPKYKARTFKAPDAAVHYVTLNCEVPPFNKREVRQAVAKAIDKNRVVQLVNGRGQVAAGILPPTIPGFNDKLKGIAYDPAGAKALLAKAGFPKGFSATYNCTSADTQRKVAQSLQQDLEKVGIKLTIKPMALPTYLTAKSSRGQVAIGSGNWSQDFPDPSNFLTTMFHSKNIHDRDSLNDAYYKNPQVDKLLDQGEAETDPKKRAAFFQQAEAIVVEDAASVPLYYPIKVHMVSQRVVGYSLHPIWGIELFGTGLDL